MNSIKRFKRVKLYDLDLFSCKNLANNTLERVYQTLSFIHPLQKIKLSLAWINSIDYYNLNKLSEAIGQVNMIQILFLSFGHCLEIVDEGIISLCNGLK